MRPLVIIESPYRASTAKELVSNVSYLHAALRDSISRGEAPFASHALYTKILNDTDAEERVLGIELGYRWMAQADLVAFYIDKGWSEGMKRALERAQELGKTTEERSIVK